MRKVFLVLLFYCSAFISVYAQNGICDITFSGRVTDADHEEPLGYAGIYIVELEDGIMCDHNGLFQFKMLCAGTYTLLISHIACSTDTIRITIEKNMFREFRLFHEYIELDEVQIHVETETYQGTLTTDYIEGKALSSVSGKSLGGVLKDMNGMNTIQTGPSISKPVIHGLHSNRILILNNGIRQEGQQWGNEHGPEIDPFIANRITVIKGAAAVKYGSDAMGGVILVDAAALPDTGKYSGAIQTAGFSNTMGGVVSSYLQGSNKPFSWRVQGTLKQEGTVRAADYYLANTAYREANYSLSAKYTNKDIESEIYYSYFNNKTGIFSASHIGNVTDLENAFVSDTPLIPGEFTYQVGRPYQQIQHHLIKSVTEYHSHRLGNILFTAGWQNNLRSEFDTHISSDDSIAALNLPALYFEIGTITVELEWRHHKKNNFSGSMGISGMNQQNITKYSNFIPNYKNYSGGIYALEKYQWYRWTAEAGVRYDYKWSKAFFYDDGVFLNPEHHYSALSWSVGTTFFDRKHFTFHMNLSSAWRAPSMNELYSDGLHHGAAALEYGDPDLLTERSYQLTSGIEYETEMSYFEFGIYNNYMQNFIYLQPQFPPALTISGAYPVFHFSQTNANIYGFDVTIHHHFIEPLLTEIKLSMLRAYDLENENWIIMMPADKVTSKVHYTFSNVGKFHSLDVGVAVTHMFKQTRTEPNADYVDAPEAYTLTSISLGSDIVFNKTIITWSVEAENLFNIAYRDYLNRFRYFADDQGRNISLRVKIPFTF